MDPEEPGHVCPIAKLLASTPRVHRPLDFGNSLMVDLAAPAWEAREMTWKALGGLALKVIVLTLALFVIYSAASLIVGLGETDPQPADGMAAMKYLLLLVCFLFTVVLSYPIMRSRWSGWPLIATVAVVLYGVSAFLSGIETAVFLKYLVDMAPGEMVPKLLMQGAIVAVLYAPLAVWVHGKMKREDRTEQAEANMRLVMPPGQWAWRLAAIAVVYVVIYILCGMFVFTPLAGDAFQQVYAGMEMPAWILPFQAGRALIWTALAIPVIRMMRGERWEAGLAVASLFSVLMGALMLLPNEFMPDHVRMAHFAELSLSNFVFGWAVVWLLTFNRAGIATPRVSRA